MTTLFRACTLATLVALVAQGCTTDDEPTGLGRDAAAVSAILNPSLADESILIERVHTGRVAIDTIPFDPANPVTSGSGVPIDGARVVVGEVGGDSVIALESAASGAGVYRFRNAGVAGGTAANALAVRPGRTYSLRVQLPEGGVISGRTTVPSAAGVALSSTLGDRFDVDTSRFTLAWPSVRGATRYSIAIQNPRATYGALLTDTAVTITGTLRNPYDELRPVLMPGFHQVASVAAIDQNYFDFVRPERASDAGARTHLEGGYGLFGSVVLLVVRALDVERATDSSPGGVWTLDAGSSGADFPQTIHLFVADRSGGDASLSGNYGSGADLRGALGDVRDGSVDLNLLSGWSARDTLSHLTGTITGSTMSLTMRGRPGSRARYTRARA